MSYFSVSAQPHRPLVRGPDHPQIQLADARKFDEYTGNPKGVIKACGVNPNNPTHYFYQKVDDSIVVSVVISASNAKKVANVFNSRYGAIKKQQSPQKVVPPGLRPLVECAAAQPVAQPLPVAALPPPVAAQPPRVAIQPPAPTASLGHKRPRDIAMQLKELTQMKESGDLSSEEFAVAKKKALSE